jgi:hypothetical protein
VELELELELKLRSCVFVERYDGRMGSVWGMRKCRGLVANNRRMIGNVSCSGWVETQFVDGRQLLME